MAQQLRQRVIEVLHRLGAENADEKDNVERLGDKMFCVRAFI